LTSKEVVVYTLIRFLNNSIMGTKKANDSHLFFSDTAKPSMSGEDDLSDQSDRLQLILYQVEQVVEDYRKHTKTEKRFALSLAVLLVVGVVVTLLFSLYEKLSAQVALMSGAPLVGLLTFAISLVERIRQCEHECSMLKLRFIVGGEKGLAKALENSSCKRLPKLRLKIGTEE